jgi:hypothetical protein
MSRVRKNKNSDKVYLENLKDSSQVECKSKKVKLLSKSRRRYGVRYVAPFILNLHTT